MKDRRKVRQLWLGEDATSFSGLATAAGRSGMALILGFTSLLLLQGCTTTRATAPAPAPPTVKVAPVTQQDVPIYSEWVATMDGYGNAQIQPHVTGYIIRQNYMEGSMVRKGDVLFES